jgi:hypothetical protein
MDETGIQTSMKSPTKIRFTTEKKQVGIVANPEQGQLTTVICCCNAAGLFILSFLMFV